MEIFKNIKSVLNHVRQFLSIAEQCANVLSKVGNPHTNNMIGKVIKIVRAASQITEGAEQIICGIEDIANGNGFDQMILGVNQVINGSKSAIDLCDIIWKSYTH